jgi:hypothetical protein
VGVQAANCVVRFDEVQTPVSLVQSRGRARQADASFLIMKVRHALQHRFKGLSLTPAVLDSKSTSDAVVSIRTFEHYHPNIRMYMSSLHGFNRHMQVDQKKPISALQNAEAAQRRVIEKLAKDGVRGLNHTKRSASNFLSDAWVPSNPPGTMQATQTRSNAADNFLQRFIADQEACR